MHNDNFKEQAQEIMKGFEMEPSEKVWQQVQGKLVHPDNRRKRLLVLFILLALITGTVFFLNDTLKNKNVVKNEWAQNDTNKKNTELKEATISASSINKNKIVDDKEQPAVKKEQPKKQSVSSAKGTTGQYKQTVTVPETANTTGNTETFTQKTKETIKVKNIAVLNDKSKLYVEITKPEINTVYENQNANPVSEPDSLLLNEDAVMSLAVVPATIETINSNDLKAKDVIRISNNTKTNTLKKAAYTSVKKKRWFFAVDIAAGKSFTGAGLFKNYAEGDYSSIPNAGQGSGSGAGSYPSPLSPGMSVSIGGDVLYRLSPKINLSFGLHYQLLQSSLRVGEKTEQPTADGRKSVFRAGSSNKYNNNNHFIAAQAGLMLPVFRIGNSTNYLKTGIAISHLIKSNALQYNFSQSVYYFDNSQLNKTIVGLYSGLAIDVTGKKKKGVLIGPEFYYGLSSNAALGMYANSHSSFWGIGIQKIFGR